MRNGLFPPMPISIHAPLRERQLLAIVFFFLLEISIHAPLRERRTSLLGAPPICTFQSTLPCGSDSAFRRPRQEQGYFNPRSLAGATSFSFRFGKLFRISIHAPLRERPGCSSAFSSSTYFNPRSLAGATIYNIWYNSSRQYFNPRSLAGATNQGNRILIIFDISIHAPLRERHLA